MSRQTLVSVSDTTDNVCQDSNSKYNMIDITYYFMGLIINKNH